MTDLTGKSVLITGGGTGLGAVLAQRFAEAGTRVRIAGRTEAALERVAAGHQGISTHPVDVTDEAFWTASLDVCRDRIRQYEQLAAEL